jgi:hypothetical protein
MPLSFGLEKEADFSSLVTSGVIVAAEGDREKVLARGPKEVSLNSTEAHARQPMTPEQQPTMLQVDRPYLFSAARRVSIAGRRGGGETIKRCP